MQASWEAQNGLGEACCFGLVSKVLHPSRSGRPPTTADLLLPKSRPQLETTPPYWCIKGRNSSRFVLTSQLFTCKSGFFKWAMLDSNQRPPPCKGGKGR